MRGRVERERERATERQSAGKPERGERGSAERERERIRRERERGRERDRERERERRDREKECRGQVLLRFSSLTPWAGHGGLRKVAALTTPRAGPRHAAGTFNLARFNPGLHEGSNTVL